MALALLLRSLLALALSAVATAAAAQQTAHFASLDDARPFVQADRVGLMGWSQAGGAVLLSINDKSIGRPLGLAHDFKAAVAFYPGACRAAAVEALHAPPAAKLDRAGAAAGVVW